MWFKRLLFAFFVCSICTVPAFAEDKSEGYQEIEWVQLMPDEDLQALLNPPELLLNIEDGSEQDNVDSLGEMTQEDETAQRFYDALKSKRIVDTFVDKQIRLPGFVVPLEADDENRVTEFFIVPYFGACLHMPPPPPNQIVHVKIDEGFVLDSLNEPFWFEGKLEVESIDHSLGSSAYSIRLDNLFPYEG